MDDLDYIKSQMYMNEALMLTHAKTVKRYIDDYGNDKCDYLIHNRLMESYYRGAYNNLLEIHKALSNKD